VEAQDTGHIYSWLVSQFNSGFYSAEQTMSVLTLNNTSQAAN